MHSTEDGEKVDFTQHFPSSQLNACTCYAMCEDYLNKNLKMNSKSYNADNLIPPYGTMESVILLTATP